MRIYLDVETYRPCRNQAFVHEKVIAIGVIEDWTEYRQESTSIWSKPYVRIHIFKEWELGNEEKVIMSFYTYLRNVVQRAGAKFVNVVGFNILRYDIPLLIQKGVEYGIASLAELNALWHNTFTIDYFQTTLPFHGMRFKGLRLELLAKWAKEVGLDVPDVHGTGEDVKIWYESSRYDEIEKHLVADLKILRIVDLNYAKIYNVKPRLNR